MNFKGWVSLICSIKIYVEVVIKFMYEGNVINFNIFASINNKKNFIKCIYYVLIKYIPVIIIKIIIM